MRHRNFQKLLETYRAIQEYQSEHRGIFPSMSDLVEMKVAGSTSVIKYYFESMERMQMIIYERSIARSSRLLPLEKSDNVMLEFIQSSKGK